MLHTITLNDNRDFRRLYSKGKFLSSPLLVTYALPNRYKTPPGVKVNRTGIMASKKTGNAVRRNRSRRLIREAYRILEPETIPGWDIVFVARAKTGEAKMQDVQKIMRGHLAKLCGGQAGQTP